MELAYQVQLVTKVLLHLPAAQYQGGVACPTLIVRTAQYSCFVTYLLMPMAARSTGMGLRPLGFLRLWVRIPQWAWMSVLSVVCCQVEISASGRSLVQRSPTECVYGIERVGKKVKQSHYRPGQARRVPGV